VKPLEQRIEAAITDDGLHEAIGRAVHALGERRAGAFASLPNAERVRDAARASRLSGLRRLDELLVAFESNAQAAGIQVHWAADAEDAVSIVADIAHRAGCTQAVKSKSMATEEVHLNAGLAKVGVAARETDLGEYIVQLADDRPSHIILPIVHLRRGDVGEVVHRELSEPYTDVPEELAAIARRRLRQDFLAADMGITGANLALADEGSIVLVSNEGNIRLTTSLPRVHVALVGIDKVVPSLDDAERILKLLARSATGQASTVYTTIVQGPSPAGDEGPDAVHIVLLDNGRSAILGGPQAEVLGCVRCGACLNVCPVYHQIGGHAYGATYPGPIGAVFMAAQPGQAFEDLPSLCSLCGACEETCPVRLPLPDMLLDLRARTVDVGHVPRSKQRAMALWAALMTRPKAWTALRRLGRPLWSPLAPLLARFGPSGVWARSRELPPPPPRSFWEDFDGAWSEPGPRQELTLRPRSTPANAPQTAGRAAFLARVREAVEDIAVAEPTPIADPPPSPIPDPLDRFIEAATALSAEVSVHDSAEAVQARVRALLDGSPALAWPAEHVPYGAADGVQLVDPSAGADATVGLTGADAAIANIGALLLGCRPGRPRTPSMLPPLHIAVLRREDIHPDRASALVATTALRSECSSVHLIAGPSRTADIELTLTLGVHGPGRLAIVIGP
jgi:L-lactate dehydrogenase complex protein LldF